MKRLRYFGWWVQGWYEYTLFKLHLRDSFVRMNFRNIWTLK